jgi:hypothetical protein
MPDKVATIWAMLDEKGRIRSCDLTKKSSMKKIRIQYHAPNKRGMGRNKGNAHERETAEVLSNWIFGQPKYLKRTPLSGGWSSTKMGDVCLDPEVARTKGYKDPKIYVECRNYKDVLQYNLLSWSWKGVPKIYTDWIREVEAKCDGRLPMLVVKGKGTDAWIILCLSWFAPTGDATLKLVEGSKLCLRVKGIGVVHMLPLERVARLGDGREFLKQWVRDGGPAILRRLAERPAKSRK